MPSAESEHNELVGLLRSLVTQSLQGERLPSQRRLSSDCGVGRAVARDALRKLNIEGLVRVRRPSRVYVAEPAR